MSPSAADDDRLAMLVAKLCDQAQAGEPVDLEGVAAAHPDLADELRQLWGTVGLAAALLPEAARPAWDDKAVAGHADVSPSTTPSNPFLSGPPLARGGPAAAARTPNGSVTEGDIDTSRRFGHFALLEEIGRGGMGVVYKALDLQLGRIVALKMLLRGDFASSTELLRFRQEAEATAKLDHPHIVPVFEVGEVDGQEYFAMKYVQGTTLAKRLSLGPLAGREAASLLMPVCRAVAAAHAQHLLHRDLKPSNILLDANGQPLVADFGLAKRLTVDASLPGSTIVAPVQRPSEAGLPRRVDGPGVAARPLGEQVTLSGAIVGTPAYMSPEQASGGRLEVGPATDVYSLGTILYHCLTGKPPFQSSSPLDMLLMVLEQDPPLPRSINSKVDPDLEMIALKCLQKPPELRYRSAEALADDLAAYLANEPISARSTTLSQWAGRMLRATHHAVVLEHWGLLWMWHSLVLLVLCVVTNVFQWQGIESRIPYLALWGVGLSAWATIFWTIRRRSGPITFVERQIAHVWASSMISSMLLFAVETILDLKALSFSPVLPLFASGVFLVKAGILSGEFYAQALALLLTAVGMAWLRTLPVPDVGLTIYGVVSAACFFFPGLKYYRQRRGAG